MAVHERGAGVPQVAAGDVTVCLAGPGATDVWEAESFPLFVSLSTTLVLIFYFLTLVLLKGSSVYGG